MAIVHDIPCGTKILRIGDFLCFTGMQKYQKYLFSARSYTVN